MDLVDCRRSDADRLSEFLHPIWTEVYSPIASGGPASAEEEFSLWLSPDAIRSGMDEGYVYGFVVIDGEEKGVYSYRIEGGGLYISKVYLSRDVRGKGLGQKVLNWLFDVGRSHGCTEATLHVYSANECAVRAYERAGMVKRGMVKAWSNGVHEEYDYVMWIAL